MKHSSLTNLFLYFIIIDYAVAQYAGSKFDAGRSKKSVRLCKGPYKNLFFNNLACEYLVDRIYCFGGSTKVSHSISAGNPDMAMLDILKYSGKTTDELNKNWVYIATQTNGLDIQRRGLMQHMSVNENKMVISGGLSSTLNQKLTYQTIEFDASTFTWSTLENFTPSGVNRQM